MNEELRTVDENGHGLAESTQLIASLAAADIATVFLDCELRILRYTPSVGQIFRMTPTDRGRPLSELPHQLGDRDFLESARSVLETRIPVEREVEDGAGRCYLTRLLPYRGTDDRIEGVVITLVDITSRKKAEEELRESKAYAERIIEALHEPLLVLDADLLVRSMNRAFEEHFGIAPDGALGRRVYELADGALDHPELHELLERVLPEHSVVRDFVLSHEFAGIGERVLLINARRDHDVGLLVLGIRDITQRVHDERALRDTQSSLAQQLRASRCLHDMMVRTYQRSTLEEVLDEVLDTAIELQGADFGNVQVLEEDGTLVIVTQRGLTKSFLEAFTRVDAEDAAVCARALQAGHRVSIEDVEADPSLASLRDIFREADIRAVQSTPMVSPGGAVLGVISTHYRRPRTASDREKSLMDVVAQRAADVVLRVRSEQKLKHLAETLEERVEERTREVRALASTLTMAEQEERRRISGLLHDDLQQLLYGIQMRLALARQQADAGDDGALLAQTDRSLELLSEAVSRTRRLTVDLTPPVLEGEGLVDAIEWIQTQMRDLHRLDVEVEGDRGLDVGSHELRVLLFHVVRELLFNVAKHSGASRACVEIEEHDGMLRVTVSDHGRGFDPDALELPEAHVAGGFGLFSARERLRLHGGGMEIESSPGSGARISAYAPISPNS